MWSSARPTPAVKTPFATWLTTSWTVSASQDTLPVATESTVTWKCRRRAWVEILTTSPTTVSDSTTRELVHTCSRSHARPFRPHTSGIRSEPRTSCQERDTSEFPPPSYVSKRLVFSISQVSEVEVDIYNLTVHVDGRSKTALVNGVQILTPWYYPNKNNWIVRVRFSGSTFTIENDQGITVTFTTYNSLCVEVPDVPAFNGPTALCGLAGNIDGKKLDDVVHRNGTVLNIKSSRQPENNNHPQFMQFEVEITHYYIRHHFLFRTRGSPTSSWSFDQAKRTVSMARRSTTTRIASVLVV